MIKQNAVLVWKEEKIRERVLWLGEREIITFDIDNPNALPEERSRDEIEMAFVAGNVSAITVVPTWAKQPEEKIEKRDREIRDNRYALIYNLVHEKNIPVIYYSKCRGELIKKLIESKEATSNGNTTGRVHKKTIYGYLRRYWRYGMIPNALLPGYAKCGHPKKGFRVAGEKKLGAPKKNDKQNPGINVDENILRLLQKYGDKHIKLCKNNKPRTKRRTWRDMVYENFLIDSPIGVDGEPIIPINGDFPTYGQFLYHAFSHLNKNAVKLASLGAHQHNLTERVVLGDSTAEVGGAGETMQIDSTPLPICLVNRVTRQPIGSVTLHMAKDVKSRAITGMHIELGGESNAGIRGLLHNVAMDKVMFCKEYGIEIQRNGWECQHLPRYLVGDRGKLMSLEETLKNALGMSVLHVQGGRGDLKAIIEKTHDLLQMECIDELPGSNRNVRKEDRDSVRGSAIDIYQLTRILINYILQHNNTTLQSYKMSNAMIQDGVVPTPMKIWRWSFMNERSYCESADMDMVRRCLLMRDKATVTRFGLEFKGATYYSKYYHEMGLLEKGGNKRWKIDILYFNTHSDQIYIELAGDEKLETCPLLPRDDRYKGTHFDEVAGILEYEKTVRQQQIGRDIFLHGQSHAKNKKISEEAEKETKGTRTGRNLSQSLMKKEMAEQKKQEKQIMTGNIRLNPSEVAVPPTIVQTDKYVDRDRAQIRSVKDKIWR